MLHPILFATDEIQLRCEDVCVCVFKCAEHPRKRAKSSSRYPEKAAQCRRTALVEAQLALLIACPRSRVVQRYSNSFDFMSMLQCNELSEKKVSLNLSLLSWCMHTVEICALNDASLGLRLPAWRSKVVIGESKLCIT